MPLPGWTAYNAAAWEMLEGSGRSRHSVDSGNSDELVYLGPWEQRYSFAQQKTGRVHPSLVGSYCGDIEIFPIMDELPPSVIITDPLDQLPTYVQNGGAVAVVVCRYMSDFSTAPWPCDIAKPTIQVGTQLRFEKRSAGQFLYMRPEDMAHEENPTWTATGRKFRHDSQAGRKLISTGELQLAWLYVEEPPFFSWDDTLIGRVNESSFLSCPPETLLFEGYDARPSTNFDLSNPWCYEISATFRKRQIKVDGNTYGWNHEYGWGDDGFGWYRVKMGDGSGGVVDRYEKVDLSSMFINSDCTTSSGY
jgi:hypothetical protein